MAIRRSARILAATALLLWEAMVLAAQPKPAFFGLAFNYKKGRPEMRLGVCAILPRGPAEGAGLLLNDQITAVDGKNSFGSAYEVLEYLYERKAGDKLVLAVIRGEQKLTIAIVATEASEEHQARMKRNLELAKQDADRDRGGK